MTGSTQVQGVRLSPQQTHLWRLQQEDGAGPYRARCAVAIEGPLDAAALRDAIQAVADAHEILRTRFDCPPGVSLPLQVIGDPEPVALRQEDLTAAAPASQEARIASFLDGQDGEEDGAGSVLRATLTALAPDHAVLLLDLPALCCDGAGLDNLVHEIAAAYAVRLGAAPEGEEPLQYADIAEWQNQLLETELGEEGWSFWRRQAEGELTALALRLPFERPAAGGFAPGTVEAELPAALLARIDAAAASRAAFLLAAWAAVLARLGNRNEITVGVGFDGRNYAELEAVPGLFARHLPVPLAIDPEQPFAELAARCEERMREAGEWQVSFSWERLLEENAALDGLAFPPCCFEYEAQPAEHAAGGLRFRTLRRRATTERFGLELAASEAGGALRAAVRHDAARFPAEEAARLLGQWAALVESAAASPRAAVGALSALDESERRRLLVSFNEVGAAAPAEPVHHLFARRAAEHPDRVAVVCEESRLTYGELESRANRLAQALRARGVVPETRVALCLERSVEMIEGILGIFKAGGAYVPLDPGLPAERLALLLRDSGARVLVTEECLAVSLAAPHVETGIEVVCLDRDRQSLAARPDHAPAYGAGAGNLAYVIYTSGSTGRPKGVAVEHRQLANYVAAVLARLDLPEGASFATVSTFAADLGHTAVFPALASGGCLHVVASQTASDPDAFGAYLRRHEVDVLKIVPSHLEALLAAADPASVLPRQRLVLGGEASRPAQVERIRALAPGCAVFNHYGPTETTVGTLAWRVEGPLATAVVPLGRPLAGTRAYVADAGLRPVPTWVAGELCVAGNGVARGYLDAPAATAERFVPDPFAAEPGGRLYRTGDRVRHLPEGTVEFLGRIDDQVKIHGFRVEPGEVAAVLRRHPGVRDAVVVVREDGGEKKLAGYWIAAAEAAAPAAPELAAYLREHLPPAMVPAALVRLTAFPLTPNGKLDRRQLPVPASVGEAPRGGFVAPRTAAERALAEIWCDLLGLERAGVHDNFFELGGDSILSIQIVARANKAGLHLTPRHLFQHQTLAELAAVADLPATVRADGGEVTGPVPLTPIQHWFFAADPAEPHHFNQSVLLELRAPLPAEVLEAALRALLAHHDALRLRFEKTARGWRQTGAPAAESALLFDQADLSSLPAAERQERYRETAARLQSGFDLARGPLLRAALLDLGEEGRRLLLIVHHLAVDGVSWRILLEDLQSACDQAAGGEQPVLPAKTTSYQRWSERLAEHAGAEATQRELAFWLEAGQAAVPPLPRDLTEGDDTVGTSDTVSMELDREATQALLQEAPRAYRTQINDLLLTALAQTLAAWAGGRTVRVELEGHGREDLFDDVDLSRTVGWFTSRFPVVLRLPADADPGVAVKSVKEQLRAIPRRGLGYGLLRHLDAEAGPALSRQPAPEVSFNYLGRFDQVLAESPLLALSRGERGPERGPAAPRRFLLDVVALVVDGQLQLTWRYGPSRHRRATVERLAAEARHRIAALVEHCRTVGVGGYTPSDLPLAGLGQEELDRLIDPRQVEDVYPLSPLQQGVLFHAVYSPSSGTYVSPSSCTLEGDLDFAVFTQAWQEVLDRYPILRTAFVWEGVPAPLQLVHRRVEMPWRQLDWRDVPAAEQEGRLEALLQEYQRQGFALERPPLMHLTLVRLGEHTHALIWCRHHLLLDGWSTSLLIREVMARYQAMRRGGRLEIAEPTRPYRDYIDWLHRQDLRDAEAFWRRTLQGFTRPLALTIENEPGTAVEDDREYDKKVAALSAEDTAALRDFARRHKLTLNTVLQGAWALLLRLYGGGADADGDVLYGGVVSGRPAGLPGAESMIGLFINTLPVRIQVPADGELLPWLAAIQEQQAEQRQYEHSPLVAVRGWSEVPHNLPLFETLYVFENFLSGLPSADDAAGDGLTVLGLRHQIRNNFPLTLRPVPGRELTLHILYEPRRFSAAAVDGILADLQLALAQMTAPAATLPTIATIAGIAAAVEASREQRRQAEKEAYQNAIFRKLKGARRQAVADDLQGESR